MNRYRNFIYWVVVWWALSMLIPGQADAGRLNLHIVGTGTVKVGSTSYVGPGDWNNQYFATGTFTITLTPASGALVESATGCNVSIPPSGSTVPVNGSVYVSGVGTTVNITFSVATYTVTVNCMGGGTVDGGNTSETLSLPFGASQTFNFTVPAGQKYIVTSLAVNNVAVTPTPSSPDFSYSLSSITQDTAITAVFTRLYTITPSCTTPDWGTISPSSSADYQSAAPPTFNFYPKAGYGVSLVTVDGVPVTWTQGSNSYTFPAPLTKDSTIAVTFAPAYTITASAGPGGSISPAGSVQVISGLSQSFSITPSSGYIINEVTVDGYGRGAASSYTFPNVLSNHWIKADFLKSGPMMQNYCTVPPYVAAYKPNVLLLIDNSASMGDLAYANADPAGYCFDDSYSDAKAYLGYFNQAQWYCYDTYPYDPTNGGFQPVGSVTGACGAASTPYLCVDLSGASPPRAVDNFCAKGNFLNWLAMSKLDVEKYVLTGGKWDVTSGKLQAESRGCQGKRFIKVAGGAGSITFAVRGPAANENDYAFGGAGASRIEIYYGSYKATCRALTGDWTSGGVDQLKQDLSACFDRPTEVINGATVPSKGSIYNLVITDCFTSLAQSTPFPADDVVTLQNDCLARYDALYGGDLSLIKSTRLDDGVCGSGMPHQPSNGNSSGFYGNCYTAGVFLSDCSSKESDDYCRGVVTGNLQDPSATAYMTGTQANIPGFFVDAGAASLGSPSGTFFVRLPLPSQAQGIVQEFANDLNLGVMTFNKSGNASECSASGGAIPCTSSCSASHAPCVTTTDCGNGGTCQADPLTDGGKVISPVGDEIGDHSTGVIAKIDSIAATSWTPIAESFYNAIGYFANRTDLRISMPGTDAAWDATQPPSQSDCQKNHILIVTDGMSTADQNPDMERLASLYAQSSGGASGFDAVNNCPPYSGSRSLRVLGWLAKNRNIKTFSTSTVSIQPPSKNSEFIATHAIFTGTASGAPGDCDPATLLQDTVDPAGNEKVVNAADPATLYNAFRNVLMQIAAGSKTGTDATILTTGRSNGAVYLQEFFYPQKSFDNGSTSASWIGEMEGLWYSIESFRGIPGETSTVRDDAGYTGGVMHTLNLSSDHVVQYSYASGINGDRILQATLSGGSGVSQTVVPEAVQSLWRAGTKLWQRDYTDRTIYSEIDGRTLTDFTTLDVSLSSIQSLLQATDANEASNIISYVAGEDFPQYRNRTIGYPLLGVAKNVWKLGDIISSTPRVQSSTPLNSYHLSPPRGYDDLSYGNLFGGDGFTDLSGYRNRGMAYVGANDGMLHAFQFGLFNTPSSAKDKATLTGADLGREEWAFIPKNALPYLKYLADVQYPHLSYVDGGITLFDAAIGDPADSTCNRSTYWQCPKKFDPKDGAPIRYGWRTILIGGMGFGGASRPSDDSCDASSAGTCVKSPVSGAGLSSYFALDVTGETFDPVSGTRIATATSPRLLWEFADSDLGYSTSGAAIIRIADYEGTPPKPDLSRNGHWYAVFASGPMGPIDIGSCQFKGTSAQSLKIFVVDLNAVPPLSRGSNYWVIDTGISNAFAGNITGGGIDVDKWNPSVSGYYQDDALYVGYSKDNDDGSWGGGVLRVVTAEDPTDPSKWKTSIVIDGIGPVTTAVAKLQDRARHQLWLYFGTGRYFYGQDDMNTPRAIFGVREASEKSTDPGKCYTLNDSFSAATCTNTISGFTNLTDKTSDGSYDPTGLPSGSRGWYITLDPADANSGAERLLVDPTSMTNGAVYFTTYKPSTDLCNPEGTSYIWAVRYDSGASLAAAGGMIRVNGKALVRQSSGNLQEVGLGSGFTDRAGRRGPPMDGRPGGMKLISNSGLKPVKKILHMQER